MTPELRAALERLPEPDRTFAIEQIEEGERASARAKFEDMGYEGCPVCKQARLRDAWVPSPEVPTIFEGTVG